MLMFEEQCYRQRFSKYVCDLLLCAYVFDLNYSLLNSVSEMVIFDVYVLCSRTHLWYLR